MAVCLWCGDTIIRRTAWPSGLPAWFALVGPPLYEWRFCPGRAGGDHQPA